MNDGQAPAGAGGPEKVAALAVKEFGLEPGLYGAARGLEVGQWSEPVETKAGWMIVKLLARTAGKPASFAAARSEARKRAQARLLEASRANTRQRLLAQASKLLTW